MSRTDLLLNHARVLRARALPRPAGGLSQVGPNKS
jgi:hypothetical protein